MEASASPGSVEHQGDESLEPQAPTSSAGNQLDETICHICKGYLTNLVTTECKHSFCRTCITQYCKEEKRPSCPKCGNAIQIRAFMSNVQDEASTLSRSEDRTVQGQEDIFTLVRQHRVDVTLDPHTANPWLILSEDGKQMRCGDTRQDLPDNPERFDISPCVLGIGGFTGGRHYWEVVVGDKPEWGLGICREPMSRKGEITLTPENGYWAVGLRGGKYKAFTSPRVSLHVSVKPRWVGIFLDYEAGKISFYNVTDKSELFTFSNIFSGMLRPYFCPGVNDEGENAAPLIICPFPAQARGNL